MDASERFDRYLAHLSQGLGHADRQAGLRGYCTGLMLPLPRKSVEPMAARLDPLHASARHQALHHFVAKAQWSDAEVLRRVAQWVVCRTWTSNRAAGGSSTTRVCIPWVSRASTAGCWASRTTAKWP